MREKLLELLKREGLKPSQLAEILEINPAGISHILAGRNKPSFELLQKILRRFPRINPDWLLLDSNQIYRSEPQGQTLGSPTPASQTTAGGVDNTLFPDSATIANRTTTPGAKSTSESTFGTQPSELLASGNQMSGGHAKAGVKRIVIFYEDQTFEAYTPTNQ